MTASLTILCLPLATPEDLERLSVSARRGHGHQWIVPLGSRVWVDTFLMKATKSDFGVFEVGENRDDAGTLLTRMIDMYTLEKDIPRLEELVVKQPAATAKALWEHGKQRGDLAGITAALASDEWPQSGDPAEEAAAFAHLLLFCARTGAANRHGVCLEYRGDASKTGV